MTQEVLILCQNVVSPAKFRIQEPQHSSQKYVEYVVCMLQVHSKPPTMIKTGLRKPCAQNFRTNHSGLDQSNSIGQHLNFQMTAGMLMRSASDKWVSGEMPAACSETSRLQVVANVFSQNSKSYFEEHYFLH